MSEIQTDSIEALQALVELAQSEVAEATAAFDDQDVEAFADLCRGHLETIGWASDMAGLQQLAAIANALLSQYANSDVFWNAETGAELVNWLNDLQLYLGAPETENALLLVLSPLPEEKQAELQASWSAAGESDDTAEMAGEPAEMVFSDGDFATGDLANESAFPSDDVITQDTNFSTGDFPQEDFQAEDICAADIPANDWPETGINESPIAPGGSDGMVTLDANLFEDDESDIGGDGMLGMLASELHDASPEFDRLAQTIAETEDAGELGKAIEAYQDIVGRILAVSDELELQGLIQVCMFVNQNISLLSEMPQAERVRAREVLQGWPAAVVEHLVQPGDDALCLAVVDYLELESWPEALPYRQVRDLIEGLISELEITGDEVIEQRQIEAKPEDVSLVMSDDVSPELVEAFFAESPGHAETLSHLMEAIAGGDNIQHNVESAQRIAHTLKGSGNLVGAAGVANLAHHVEDIFEYIAKQKMSPPQVLAEAMQEAADTLESMLECMQGVAPEPEDAQAVLQKVLDWANRIDQGNVRLDDLDPESPDAQRRHRIEPEAVDLPEGIPDRRKSDAVAEEPVAAATASAVPTAETVRVPLDVLDNMFRVVSETAIAIGQIQEHLNRLDDGDKTIRKNDTELQQRRYELENLVSIRGMAAQHRIASASHGDDFDPLEMDVYDEFYGATHAYIEGVADSRHILREFTAEVSELSALFLLQQRLNKELQEVIMTTRMVPVNTISARLQRTVRQVCRSTGKQAELFISGEDLMLDGDVLNKLADPLMHMLRNAVDHGIETAEARRAAGKPESGRITLIFRQEGNSVVVDCSDDGIGLNYERIRNTAIRHGMIGEQETPSNEALARMILQSGFSTRDNVTQVSGRGVGMDVVNNTIQGLKGSMDVGDGTDGGTLVSLRLPITLLTSHCLLVGAGGDATYAIPTTALTQILSPGTGKLGRVGNNITYQLGKEVYTTYSLESLLGRPEADEDNFEECSVMLVQTGDGVKAVTVDTVVSSYDLVLKNMGAYIKSLSGVAGVSILGDGSVVTVLDLPSLLLHRDDSMRSSITQAMPQQAVAEAALPKVLIVDDSLSVRSSLSQLMADGGYQVVTARDGLEAVNVLESESPDIVLTDLEMPRMNGLDLVGYIRNSEQWSPLPVVMITSRTMAKHRQQAEQAGVNTYITKPFTEDEVLASIDRELVSLH